MTHGHYLIDFIYFQTFSILIRRYRQNMRLWNYLATPDTHATNPTVGTIIVKILEKYADHL
jgi:hypothetical protein